MDEFSRKIKKLCEKYIEERDVVHIIKIFAPITKYSLSSLIEIAKDQSNDEILVLFLNKYSMNEFFLVREYVLFVRNYVHDNNNNTDRMYSYNEENTSIKTIFYYVLKFIFVWYYYEFFSVQKTKVLEDFEIEKDDDFKENCIENKHNFVFYRGQSNKDWRLSPSIIRGLNGDIYLDDDYYYDLLQKDGSEAKYNQLIRCEDRNAYSKYAFMQHARSFSPFIDLTYSKEIATSFALSNSNNVNTFRNIDAAIFEIKIN